MNKGVQALILAMALVGAQPALAAVIGHGALAPVGGPPGLGITDGTSNTIVFNELPNLPFPGAVGGLGGPPSITDGTSNTILFGERPESTNPLPHRDLGGGAIAAVPEVSTWLMMLFGFAGLAMAGSRVSSSPSAAALRRSAASARR